MKSDLWKELHVVIGCREINRVVLRNSGSIHPSVMTGSGIRATSGTEN